MALRIASAEGGIKFGAVGDGGHAFGPFQMNDAGGVLTHRPGNHAAYANSAQGINDAVAGIAKYARGLHGRAGVAAGVRGYERPAAPGAEIERAMGHNIGKTSGMSAGSTGLVPSPAGGVTAPAGNFKSAVAQYFLQASNALASGQQPDPGGLAALAQARQQAGAMQQIGAKQATFVTDHAGPLSPNAPGIVKMAQHYLGTKYVWGGTTPKGFDCSGFVQYLYAQKGVKIGRTTYDQIKQGTPVNRKQLAPGDVVFFSKSGDVHHEGMYIGHGQFIHAPHTGDVVKISSLSEPYYAQQFAGGRRMA